MAYLILSLYLYTYTVSADSSLYIEPLTYLYGNVELLIDTVKVKSNSALLTEDSIMAWGDLKITKKDLTVYGGVGRYFFDRVYYIQGGIRAEDDNDTLIAENGIFYESEDEVSANGSLEIWNDERTIAGDNGLYDFTGDIGVIKGDVRLKSHGDTVELISDSVALYGDSLLVATNNILKKGRFRVSSDTLLYYTDRDSIVFWGKPIVTTESDSLTGNYIEIIIKEHKIIRLRARGNVKGKRKD